MNNPDAAARRTAIRSAGLARDAEALPNLLKSLTSADLAESRESAAALGRIADQAATAPLLAELKRAADPFHEQAVIYALIQIADRAGTAAALSAANPAVRRGAMIALDQMRGGNLLPEEILPLLAADDVAVRREAQTIVATRSQWAGKVAEQLRAALANPQTDAREQRTLRDMVVLFARDAGVQSAVADALHADATPAGVKIALLEALASAPMKTLPDPWNEAIGDALGSSDEAIVRQAVATVSTRAAAAFDDRVARIARDQKRSVDLRVAALSAVAARITPSSDDLALLLSQLDAGRAPLTRLAAVRCIVRLSLSDAQLTQLATTALAIAGPLELSQLLGVFEKSASSAVGLAAVQALKNSKAAPSLSATTLRSALRNFPPNVMQAAEPLLKQADAADAQRMAKLAELQPLLSGGDASRGQSVFLGKTAACATCHAVGGFGAQVGPDLSKIGAIRAGSDLLESIIFPSASIARGFEPFVVETTDGKMYAGILAGESADSVLLKTPAEMNIPRSQIKALRQDRVSIMPQGLDAQLSRQELIDLLAFLQACK